MYESTKKITHIQTEIVRRDLNLKTSKIVIIF